MRCGICMTVFTVLLVGQAPVVSADDVYLVHGGKVEGTLPASKQPGDGKYTLETPFGGRLVLAAEQVERVVEKSAIQLRYEAMLPLVPDTEAGHLDMAERCERAGLKEQQLFHLEHVVRHNPDHKDARYALGYSLVDGRWLQQDQWMKQQGYERYRGGWRLPQEIKLLKAQEARDAAVVAWKKKVKVWRSWILKRRGDGEAQLRAIDDPLAIPSLAALLDNDKEHRQLKLLYVDVLGKFPGDVAVATLTKHALHDADAKIREACLDQLERTRPPFAVAAFIEGLKHDKNAMVNRAALALSRMQDPAATLPLIDALVTEHKHVVMQGGGLRPTFSNQGSGFSAGGKPEIKRINQRNEAVLHALAALHKGVNFGFNQTAWKNWYIAQMTPPPVHLRRSD